METRHAVVAGDARRLPLPDDAVELVVTSPPYPMVEMWDEAFGATASGARAALDDGDGEAAFAAMHDALDEAWAEVARVLVPGGVACVVVGDAARTLDRFRLYRNRDRVGAAFEALGFDPLPDVVWRKPANSAATFMGSGMLPPNAYVTLEHESVLVFRNGARRSFDPGAERRYEAAYFWEERNRWFSDVWTDVRGVAQGGAAGPRERTAAYPFAVPYRLVNMYSVYGDRVLDPFWGTGTTTLAAMTAARDSVGVERHPDLVAGFAGRVGEVTRLSREVTAGRLADHAEFVAGRDDHAYEMVNYDLPVRTKQERRIQLYEADSVQPVAGGYTVRHAPAAP
ncbi:MAG: DNA modification methylase [uncultured archaeon A07HB70]|nr:MAG: DNA modification methylase [uncultured archaeon A07HB70]